MVRFFNKDRTTVLLLIFSIIVFAVAVLTDLSQTITFILLIWIAVLVLFGVVSYNFEDQ